MSGISFWELVIIFVIGLIVLGPERLPRVANQLGTWLGQARRMTRVMKRQLEDELNLERELSIRPQTTPRALPDTAPAEDDTYSPAHGPDSVGTGVGDASPAREEQDDDSDEPAAGEAPAAPDEQEEAATGTEPDRKA